MGLSTIPNVLIGVRFVIAPLLLWDALDHQTGAGFVIGYVVAVLSDIFDGVLARRFDVSTARLRQADSWADLCLYLCVFSSVWLLFPQVVLRFKTWLLLAAIAQISLFAISLIKFGKLPSFHGYSAKLWGLTLLVATVGLFGFNSDKALGLTIGFCWVNSLEEIGMTLLLPEWQCDVPSLFHAIGYRKALNQQVGRSL
jgi:phosphatidylglycerophosphate synthase